MQTMRIRDRGANLRRASGQVPATTADFWSTTNLGINYSLVFLAWGPAGVIGPQSSARFPLDIFGNYYAGFITTAVLAAIAFGLTFV